MDIEIKFGSLNLLIMHFVGGKGRHSFLTIKEIMELASKYGNFECTEEEVRSMIIELADLNQMFINTENGLVDGIGI
ncbi:TPA: hypothetical protein ACKR33_002571 [Providencia rettgeri]